MVETGKEGREENNQPQFYYKEAIMVTYWHLVLLEFF